MHNLTLLRKAQGWLGTFYAQQATGYTCAGRGVPRAPQQAGRHSASSAAGGRPGMSMEQHQIQSWAQLHVDLQKKKQSAVGCSTVDSSRCTVQPYLYRKRIAQEAATSRTPVRLQCCWEGLGMRTAEGSSNRQGWCRTKMADSPRAAVADMLGCRVMPCRDNGL